MRPKGSRRKSPNAGLVVAIFVDVDGTLAGPYHKGKRPLRASAGEALAMLAGAAPVFLWSIVGADNGARLLAEFPELGRHVAGTHGKAEFPLRTVEHPFAIDDELIDSAVLSCRHFILESSYFGGPDSDDLLRAAAAVVDEIRARDA
jgi:hypothetical protein